MRESKAEILKVEVSDRVNTFLFLSFQKKKGEEFKYKERTNSVRELICKGIHDWKKRYQEKLVSLYKWNSGRDRKRIKNLQDEKLLFCFIDRKNGKESGKYNAFSFPLVGRHDFVYLLEAPNLIEMSSMIDIINTKLVENEFIKGSLNMSSICADFRVKKIDKNENEETVYFLGKEKPWFSEDDGSQRKIDVFNDWVYAITCVELKKGMKKSGSFVGIEDFLARLTLLSENSIKCMIGMFLGLGLHELVIVFGNEKLSNIITSVADLREIYLDRESNESIESVIRNTSTIFCEPQSLDACEDCVIDYSVLLSTIPGGDNQALSELKKEENKEKVRKWTKEGIEVFERQGYYDLIVSFRSSSLFHALKLSTLLYEIDTVLGTSTIVKMKEDDVQEKLREWRKENKR